MDLNLKIYKELLYLQRATLSKEFEKIFEEVHILIPEESKIPVRQNVDSLDETKIFIKLFDSYSGWTWYLSEYDPESKIAYGYVAGEENEWGSVYIPELEDLKQYGIPRIERDLHFEEGIPFKKVIRI